jgi:predicted nucleotidyltransferase
MVPECQERIKDTLEKEDDIVLAYLFGSYARDDTTSLSDIDIGILFNSGIDSLHRHNIKLKLMGEIAQACKVNKII